MGTLHRSLKNGADLYVNECQKIQHYRTTARSTEERRRIRKRRKKKKNAKSQFFISRGVYVIAMLYTHSIRNQP